MGRYTDVRAPRGRICCRNHTGGLTAAHKTPRREAARRGESLADRPFASPNVRDFARPIKCALASPCPKDRDVFKELEDQLLEIHARYHKTHRYFSLIAVRQLPIPVRPVPLPLVGCIFASCATDAPERIAAGLEEATKVLRNGQSVALLADTMIRPVVSADGQTN